MKVLCSLNCSLLLNLVTAVLIGCGGGSDKKVKMIANPAENDNEDNSGKEHQTIDVPELMAHWTFKEDSATSLTDSSRFELNGKILGAGRTVDTGHAALLFDGRDDYVQMESEGGVNLAHLSKLGQGTISIWFKLNSLPQDARIYPILYYGSASACDFFDAANQGLIVEVGHHPVHWESKRLYFTIWQNGCTYPSFCFDSNHPLEAGVWYHFAAVIGPGFNTGFLNGEEMRYRNYNFGRKSDSQFFENAMKHEELWLGRGYWNMELNYFDGLIGEIRIYNYPLTAEEVETLCQNVDM